MYYLSINDTVVHTSARLLDCTEEAGYYATADSDMVVIYDEVGPLLRLAKSHEPREIEDWPWKQCIRLVVDNDSSN